MNLGFSYPPPTIVAEHDHETLREQRISAYLAAWNDLRATHPDLNLPEWTVHKLRNGPIAAALNVAAGGDMYFVVRGNEIARAAVLVDFAEKGDLDLHGLDTRVPGHPDGVIRHQGESDQDYRARIIEAKAGASAAGPDEWWLKHARAADSRVRSIGLAYRGKGHLDIYLLSRENGGVPDSAMLTAVETRLRLNWVRPRTIVTLSVHSAVIAEVDVVADIWLHPEAPESRLAALKSGAFEQHGKDQALDLDMTRHYLSRILDASDVYSIDLLSPAADLIADPSRAYAIRSIGLRLAGRAR